MNELIKPETDCSIEFQGQVFTSSGSWLTEAGGAVYIIEKNGHITAQTWNGELISANVQITSEWQTYHNIQGRLIWKSIRFSIANMNFSGRFCSSNGELCRVKRVK